MATQIPRQADHLHAFGVAFIDAAPENASGAYAVVRMPDLEVRLEGANGATYLAAAPTPDGRPRPDA